MSDETPDNPSEAGKTHTEGASTAAFGWIVLAYTLAVVAAVAVLYQPWVELPESILLRALIADCVATLVIYGFSCAFDNASFYDAYWSVVPPVLLGYFFFAQDAQFDLRALLLVLLVSAWGVRLTHNWARGWQGLGHADWRYVDLAIKTAPFWWLVNLLGIHFFPTLLVFLGCLSIQLCFAGEAHPFHLLDLLATVIGWSALWLEMTADNQLRKFRTNPVNKGQLLTTGVWAWCRHPNYLGEIGFWVALFVYAWAAKGGAVFELAVWGPIAMVALFAGISIPMIDKRLENRTDFLNHKGKTFALLPLNHLRRSSE